MFPIIIPLLLTVTYTSQQQLYNRSVVEVLSSSTFPDRIYGNSESLYVVKFYAPWCGHCRYFAPAWQKLSSELKAWKPHVSLAVVNCDEDNDLCRRLDIEGYPTFKYFEPFSKDGDKGTLISFNDRDISGIDAFKRKMLDTLDKVKRVNRPSWMSALDFYRGRIQDEFHKNYDSVIMVVERRNSYVGRMLIMDRLKYRDRIPIFRLRAQNRDLPLYGQEKFAIYVHDKGNTRRLEAENVYKRGIINAESKPVPEEEPPKAAPLSSNEIAAKPVKPSSTVYQADLECGLTYMFKREVPSKDEISGQSFVILQEWLNILLEYLPLTTPVRNSIEAINDFVKQSGGTIKGSDLREVAEVVEKDRYLPEKCYICQGSKPYYRGYPCALWQILHTLTVKLSEKTTDDEETQRMLKAIRGYIGTFFMCKMCSKHFTERTSDTERIKSPDDLIFLIYEVHNLANHALSKTLTEDPQAPKAKFPPKEICPDCDTKDGLLRFLKKFYQPDTSVAYPMNAKKSLGESPWFKLQEEQNKLKQGLDPNERSAASSIISPGLKLYIPVFVLIMCAAIIAVHRRGRRKIVSLKSL